MSILDRVFGDKLVKMYNFKKLYVASGDFGENTLGHFRYTDIPKAVKLFYLNNIGGDRTIVSTYSHFGKKTVVSNTLNSVSATRRYDYNSRYNEVVTLYGSLELE